jgi:transposase
LVEHGESRASVARVLGVHPKTLARWLRLARRPRGLEPRPPRGPCPGLSDEQVRQLEQLLRQGPRAHGWHDPRWNVARVARLIERHFGRRYHPEHVRKLLKRRLGWPGL